MSSSTRSKTSGKRSAGRLKTSPGLLSEFKAASYADWKQAAEVLLKGASFDKKMVSLTHEGIPLQPMYNASDTAGLERLEEMPGQGSRYRSGKAAGYLGEPWRISQETPASTPEEFNSVILHELMRGLGEVNVPLDMATAAGLDPDHAIVGQVGACGVSLAMLQDYEKAFNKVDLSIVPVYFRSGVSGLPIAIMLLALAKKRALSWRSLRGCIEMDPLGTLGMMGALPCSLEQAYREMAILTRYAADLDLELQTVSIQTGYIHDFGGNAVQELGMALATGVEYLREMQQRGLEPGKVAPRMRFSFSVGTQFFMELAKFRAARLLWSRVLEAFGIPEDQRCMYLHARSSIRCQSHVDPYVNILRGTTEAFSAALGGVDGMHVSPFDETFKVPDEFSRRVARNIQVILQEECDVPRIVDPAGGSWFVESLTEQLAKAGWDCFQDLEKTGGMGTALLDGKIRMDVSAVWDKRVKSLGQRRETLVGINNYPNPKEPRPELHLPDYPAIHLRRANQIASYRTSGDEDMDMLVMDSLTTLMSSRDESLVDVGVSAALAGASFGELCRALRSKDDREPPVTIPMHARRLAGEYEKLIQACWKQEDETGSKPVVFQANFGPSRFYRARADWTSNFFAVGGFAVKAERDFTSVDELVAACKQSGSRIVVLCAADDSYPKFAADAAVALREQVKGIVILLAGAPGEDESSLREAGVQDFINVRSNNYETLKTLLNQTGVLS